jgi:hypothetical protein
LVILFARTILVIILVLVQLAGPIFHAIEPPGVSPVRF